MPSGDPDNVQDAIRRPVAEVLNGNGRAPVLLVCEHASNHVPDVFGGLGASAEARASHVAWDPGALEVAAALSSALDAPLVASTVSRLVYDCNRPPDAPDAMPARSEQFDIPGNRDLTAAKAAARIETYYRPFEALLDQTIAGRPAPPALVTVHSFTPVYLGTHREVELGILHDNESRLADALLALAPEHTTMTVLRNAPYGPEDGVTHTLRRHGLRNGLLNVMLEIRNDLIADAAAQIRVATMLAGLLRAALAGFGTPPRRGAMS